jgi:hypothetical protein
LHCDLAADIGCVMWMGKNFAAARFQPVHGRRIPAVGASFAFTLAAVCAPAHAQAPIVTAWQALNAECKGGVVDDPKTMKACKKRDEVSARLRRRGCVYQEDGDWWKCRR